MMFVRTQFEFGQASDGTYVVFVKVSDGSFARIFKGTYEGMMGELGSTLSGLLMASPGTLHDIVVYEAPHATP